MNKIIKMKYIKNLSLVFLAFGFLLLSSCNDFLDVNDNPTKVRDANLKVLLPNVIEKTSAAHYKAMLTANRITHQLDHVSGYYGNKITMGGNWITSYLSALNNLKIIVEKSEDKDHYSPHYKGIARIIQAIHIGMITDFWENAPYSDALKGSENTTPTYDSQENLYSTLFEYLDEAIPLLEADESFYSPGKDDLIYSGDLSKWVKLAHSLKARYLLHLSNKSNVDWNKIVNEAQQGLSSNADNFQLFYNDVSLNPIYDKIALSNQTGNLTVTFGKMYVDMLNGTSYDFDPRIEKIVDKDTFPNYEGLATYDLNAPKHTCEISTKTWYAQPSAPIIMMSYSESKFIEAEALLKSGGTAYDAYEAGIIANMEMLGLSSTKIDAYISALNGSVDLEHIMKEKYIALIFNHETWNDMRRLDFNPDIFKGFVRVTEIDGKPLERTGPAQRALYPDTEFSRNNANAKSNFKSIDEKMWKDKN